MTDFEQASTGNPAGAQTPGKRAYTPPSLVLFGQVAALTQSATGCGMDDNVSCDVGGGMGPKPSDPALKHNIARVGTHPLGIGLYLFDYKPGTGQAEGRHFGVMADEVEQVLPQAVVLNPDGYRMVDYRLLGIRFPH
ncbi:tail fiber domain-containing protein [Ramlibacter sp.]|uniref:tail fiber domain-containing protein n=1 Tax=Ramlibacter sp. TaxID=1917967 RepID=UPI0017F52456|nr:tail fiber domain-containing protein [Ramlibacter sp.]MBA2676000.1 tail fiber domain-containing protein [Ramlibacter sp.]